MISSNLVQMPSASSRLHNFYVFYADHQTPEQRASFIGCISTCESEYATCSAADSGNAYWRLCEAPQGSCYNRCDVLYGLPHEIRPGE